MQMSAAPDQNLQRTAAALRSHAKSLLRLSELAACKTLASRYMRQHLRRSPVGRVGPGGGERGRVTPRRNSPSLIYFDTNNP